MVWVVVGCVAQFCGVMLTVRSENVAFGGGGGGPGWPGVVDEIINIKRIHVNCVNHCIVL